LGLFFAYKALFSRAAFLVAKTISATFKNNQSMHNRLLRQLKTLSEHHKNMFFKKTVIDVLFKKYLICTVPAFS